mgnify:FL=1
METSSKVFIINLLFILYLISTLMGSYAEVKVLKEDTNLIDTELQSIKGQLETCNYALTSVKDHNNGLGLELDELYIMNIHYNALKSYVEYEIGGNLTLPRVQTMLHDIDEQFYDTEYIPYILYTINVKKKPIDFLVSSSNVYVRDPETFQFKTFSTNMVIDGHKYTLRAIASLGLPMFYPLHKDFKINYDEIDPQSSVDTINTSKSSSR